MGLRDDSEETRRIGIWDEKHPKRKVIEVSTEEYAILEELALRKFNPHGVASMTKSHAQANPKRIPIVLSAEQYDLLEEIVIRERSHGVTSMISTPAECKLAINAMFMAYSAICPSQKSITDVNEHLTKCLTEKDTMLAVFEALDILCAGIDRNEWFEEA